ncbi:hypothetical protein SmJEL517_g02742 [Synchytrium microbalum]|uniref:Pleckstrin homology domain-containing protein n=1 Tax=Synchytrium microbalum TaxID=1806994 RepID=A0A507CAX9_9FUNG|nr:uncharacterized protein SmJEL517_g02742 [Synchytrium microbalum]TPX34683.1 hypothetical protein SmJEL517_g02742 [Synchytrium microbalum]
MPPPKSNSFNNLAAIQNGSETLNEQILLKRLEDRENEVKLAAEAGLLLIEEVEQLRNRVKLLEKYQTNADSRGISPSPSFDEIKSLKSGFDHLTTSVKGVVTKIRGSSADSTPVVSRSPSSTNIGDLKQPPPTPMWGLSTPSPLAPAAGPAITTQPQPTALIPSRSSLKRTQTVKYTRPSSQSNDAPSMDAAMSNAINNSLLEVSRAQQLKLKQTEKLCAESQARVLELQETTEMFKHRLSRAMSDKDRMDAQVYELEVRVQKAEEHTAELQANMTKLSHENSRLKAERVAAESRVESLRSSEQHLQAAHEKLKISLETESQRHRSALASLQRDNKELKAKVEELASMKQGMQSKLELKSSPAKTRTDSDLDNRPSTPPAKSTPFRTPNSSMPPSPDRNGFMNETLATSLALTQTELSEAMTKIQSLSTENVELGKLLSDAQETIEALRHGSGSLLHSRPTTPRMSPRSSSPTKSLHLEMLKGLDDDVKNSNDEVAGLTMRNGELERLLLEAEDTIRALRSVVEDFAAENDEDKRPSSPSPSPKHDLMMKPVVADQQVVQLELISSRILNAVEKLSESNSSGVANDDDVVVSVDRGQQTEPLLSVLAAIDNLNPIRGLPGGHLRLSDNSPTPLSQVYDVSDTAVNVRRRSSNNLLNHVETGTDVPSPLSSSEPVSFSSSTSSLSKLAESNDGTSTPTATSRSMFSIKSHTSIRQKQRAPLPWPMPSRFVNQPQVSDDDAALNSRNGAVTLHPSSLDHTGENSTRRDRENVMVDFMEQWKRLGGAPSERTLFDDGMNLNGASAVAAGQTVDDGSAGAMFKVNPVECLTQTMIGSWFQKYDRRNKRSHLRFVWVNPYSRLLNWAPQPPSQGGRGIKTKTAFITDIKFTGTAPPVLLEPNHPPTITHSIDIITSDRLIRLIPTNWMDFRMWTQGISLLLSRARQAAPLHEQFQMVDLDGGEPSRENSTVDADDDEEEDDGSPPQPFKEGIVPAAEIAEIENLNKEMLPPVIPKPPIDGSDSVIRTPTRSSRSGTRRWSFGKSPSPLAPEVSDNSSSGGSGASNGANSSLAVINENEEVSIPPSILSDRPIERPSSGGSSSKRRSWVM